MKQKHNHRKMGRRIIISCAIFVVAAASTITVLKYQQAQADSRAVAKPAQGGPTLGAPQFSFNAAAAPGWHQGPVDKVSLAMFSDDNSCWTYIHHKEGTVDAVAALQKIEAGQADGGYTVTPGDVLTLALKTTAGEVLYELHQLSVSGMGSGGAPYGGQEFGYFSLASGYAKIEGYCHTVDQLPTITTALQALTFDVSK